MKHLSEALSKSAIKKIKRHDKIMTKFNFKDIESGDIVIEKVPLDEKSRIWMYLSHDDFMKHIHELNKIQYSEKEAFKNSKGVFVMPCYVGMSYGLYRIPSKTCYEFNGQIYSDKSGEYKLVKLVKLYGKVLDNDKSIKTIFQENNAFEQYL